MGSFQRNRVVKWNWSNMQIIAAPLQPEKPMIMGSSKGKEVVKWSDTKRIPPLQQKNLMGPGSSSVMDSSDIDSSNNEKTGKPSMDYTRERDMSFLALQEANNISRAAFKELLTIAFEAKTWITATPALGSLKEFLQEFRSLPPPGRRVERSVECAIVPIHLEGLLSTMAEMDKWALGLSHIVRYGRRQILSDIMKKLFYIDGSIHHLSMVEAELYFPSPLMNTRKLKFLRCIRKFDPDIWVIVDLSEDYFSDGSNLASEQNCRRRPSGLIARKHEKWSKVIWIENMEVDDSRSQDCAFSGMIKLDSPFSAKRWVSALACSLNRRDSRSANIESQVYSENFPSLLTVAGSLKKIYIDMVCATPDESNWSILSNKGIRIMSNALLDDVEGLGRKNFIGVATFQVHAKPLAVYSFLVDKNKQWQSSPDSPLDAKDPEELIKLVSADGSNCITLYKNGQEFLFQEASKDGFSSFIVSAPLSQVELNDILVLGDDPFLHPSGYAIMPVGSDGIDSDASLITIAMQERCENPDLDTAIAFVSDIVALIIEEIRDEFWDGKEECEVECWDHRR